MPVGHTTAKRIYLRQQSHGMLIAKDKTKYMIFPYETGSSLQQWSTIIMRLVMYEKTQGQIHCKSK